MFKTILSLTKKKKDSASLVVYTNQWRFRQTRGIVHNGAFYYNTGSLDGNEMMRQFMDIVLSYETITVKMFVIVSDGGGCNVFFQAAKE